MRSVLIIEDEKVACDSLGQFLHKKGYQPTCAYSFHEGGERIATERYDICLIDVRLPDGNGLDLISLVRKEYPEAIIVVLTAYATIEDAVTALKSGADHYLIKPVDLDELLMVLKKEEQCRSVRAECTVLRDYVSSMSGFDNLIGKSAAMVPVLERIQKLCLSDANVLVTGESGSGKELVARTLHYAGRRRDRRFVAVNCAALPAELLESELFGHAKGAFTGAIRDRDGKFEYADGGTIFLDEIGEMCPALQGKFLRILQEQVFEKLGSNRPIQVDVRIIASTNRDLKKMVVQGDFREDLYWRLNVIEIHMPPLRERVEDIELLTDHFAKKYAARHGKPVPKVPSEVFQVFRSYTWPGNIRELENVVERAVTLMERPEITVDLLPTRLRKLDSHYSLSAGVLPEEGSLKQMLKDFEKRAILNVLREEDGNRTRAAERLGISLRSLQYKLKDHGI